MIDENKKRKALLQLSEGLQAAQYNHEIVDQICETMPELPEELKTYLHESADAISKLLENLVYANEVVIQLDEALEEMRKR